MTRKTVNKTEELWSNVKERVSNPLVFSFFTSWMVCNWRIVIPVLFRGEKIVENEGYPNMIKYIEAKLPYSYFWLPLGIAFGYTFLMPFFKTLINGTVSLSNKLGNNINLRLIKQGKISLEHYLTLKAQYDGKAKHLEEAIAEQNTYVTNFNQISSTLDQTQKQLSEANQALQKNNLVLQRLNDLTIFNGEWDISVNEQRPLSVSIKNGRIQQIGTKGGDMYMAKIEDLFFDSRNKSVLFIKNEQRDIGEIFLINRLKMIDVNKFEGDENGRDIIYKRRE